ncbi:MAG TPA: VWA domain-containing protein [Bryobacteraceae bacterium]|nr:VWA domain-containing protein [Bryobacteraceae bacterium]
MARGNPILPFCLCLSTSGLAQTHCPEPPSNFAITFGTNVTVVTVPVVVRGRDGHVIGGLNRDDFQIFDKGKRQVVSNFSVSEAAVSKTAAALATSPEVPLNAADSSAAAPSNHPNKERYVAYLFDDRDAAFPDLVAVREAAHRHFKTIPPGDHSAIYTFSGRTKLEFSSDKDQLDETVKKIQIQPGQGHDAGTPCPNVTYYLADLIVNAKDERALNAATRQTMQCLPTDEGRARWLALSTARKVISLTGPEDTRVALDTLRATIRRLAEVPGQRLIVLASPGFFPRTPDERSALGEVLDLAAQNNVIVSTLDIRGVHMTHHDNASQPIPSTSVEEQYYIQSALASGDVLEDLAHGTGGTLFHNNNDLTTGFARVTTVPEIYYLLGFSPQDLKPDGSFHALKIRLPNRKGAGIQARAGYYAPAALPTSRKTPEQEIHDAVFSREELSGIPLDIAAQISKSGGDSARVLLVAKVHVECLHFRKSDGRNRDSLTIVYAMFDDTGSYVEGNAKTVDLALRDETMALDAAINQESAFVMKPGRYVARVVVRDSGGKTMSARNLVVTVR